MVPRIISNGITFSRLIFVLVNFHLVAGRRTFGASPNRPDCDVTTCDLNDRVSRAETVIDSLTEKILSVVDLEVQWTESRLEIRVLAEAVENLKRRQETKNGASVNHLKTPSNGQTTLDLMDMDYETETQSPTTTSSVIEELKKQMQQLQEDNERLKAVGDWMPRVEECVQQMNEVQKNYAKTEAKVAQLQERLVVVENGIRPRKSSKEANSDMAGPKHKNGSAGDFAKRRRTPTPATLQPDFAIKRNSSSKITDVD